MIRDNNPRLLILTQKADAQDPILGFFHGWVAKFAQHFQSIILVCLQEGSHHFPGNVCVLSLGKEKGVGRLGYVRNFFSYIWKERRNYDAVFVHMNQEYVLLGGIFWKLWGKKIVLWRNHATGSVLTRLAVFLSDEVCCTSPQSFTARFAKTRLMPVGVDTDVYTPNKNRTEATNEDQEMEQYPPSSILCLGRMSPVKHIDVLIAALHELEISGVELKTTIVGSAVSKSDEVYEQKIHAEAASLVHKGSIVFIPAISPTDTIEYYRRAEIYVNLTPRGSFDKTIIEAMACGAITLVSNIDALRSLDPDLIQLLGFQQGDSHDLADKISALTRLSPEKKRVIQERMRRFALSHHSLTELSRSIRELYE